jgi:hypothetical protein
VGLGPVMHHDDREPSPALPWLRALDDRCRLEVPPAPIAPMVLGIAR